MSTAPTAGVETDAYRRDFEALSGARDEPAWLRESRDAAFRRFDEHGFPTTREEAWRHTSLARLVRASFAVPGADVAPGPETLAHAHLPGLLGPVAVFVNGRYSAELSAAGEANPGVEVRSLREVLRAEPHRVRQALVEGQAGRGTAFVDLNQAFFEDGAFVSLAAEAIASHPIHLVYLSTGDSGRPGMSHPRNLILAGPRSEARVISTLVGPDGHAYLANPATDVHVGEGARVEHYRWQREGSSAFHFAALRARVERNGRFVDRSFLSGAALARQEAVVSFAGEGGECVLDGLFFADGERHTDVHTVIDHAQPHCTSREHYKGILDGRARGVFTGLVRVRAGAQKTDSAQSNRNLLLSRDALVHSTPQLEILADDVKCKHGSTTGQLDLAALFYLRSRGIGEEAARGLLTWAFASELVRAIPIAPLRAAVTRDLSARLAPGLGLEAA